jgi:hypothetical protein
MLDNIKKLICLGKNPTPHNLEIKAQCRPIKTTLLKGKIKLLRFPSAPVLLLNLKTRERLEQTRAHGGHDSKIILVRSI